MATTDAFSDGSVAAPNDRPPKGTMRWDLGTLRDHVQRFFGQEQRRVVSNCIRSVVDRRAFSRYHYNAAMQAIAEKIDGKPDYEVMAAMLGAYDKDTGSFESARFTAYANIVSCVHSMRAFSDNFVHLVYFATGMNLDSTTHLKERRVEWSTVRKKVAAPKIVEVLDDLHNHEDFKYLAALDNHNKHRGIVEVGFSIDIVESAHGMRIQPFSYEGVGYPKRWVHQTLSTEYQRQEGLIMEAGNHLNDYVAGLHSKMS